MTTMLDSSHLRTQTHWLLFPALAATTAVTIAGYPTEVHIAIADPVGVQATQLVRIPLRVSQPHKLQSWKRK